MWGKSASKTGDFFDLQAARRRSAAPVRAVSLKTKAAHKTAEAWRRNVSWL